MSPFLHRSSKTFYQDIQEDRSKSFGKFMKTYQGLYSMLKICYFSVIVHCNWRVAQWLEHLPHCLVVCLKNGYYGSVETGDRPASSLVVSLGKALIGIASTFKWLD